MVGVLNYVRVVGLLLLASALPVVLIAFFLDLILLLRHPHFKLERLLFERAWRDFIQTKLDFKLFGFSFFSDFDILLADADQLWLAHHVIAWPYLLPVVG